MDDGAGPEDELAWAPPSGPPPPELPEPPPPPVPEAEGLERGGAAIAAGLFGGLAGITLPPLLFWIAFSILFSLGAPDLATTIGAFLAAFAIPSLLFLWLISLFGRSSVRYRGSRTALAVAATVTMGMWLFLAVIAAIIIVVLRSMG